MFLYITSSITIITVIALIVAIVFRYWEIRVGRINVQDQVVEIGFWNYASKMHEYVVRKSTHHGSRFGNLLWVKIVQLFEAILDYHHVKKITGMVKGEQETIVHADTASGYLRDITARKNEVRKEQNNK